MYASKEVFRQYLRGPFRQYMSFQGYLAFIAIKEGETMDEQLERGLQAVRELEVLLRQRAGVAACMILLQLAVYLDQRSMEGAPA